MKTAISLCGIVLGLVTAIGADAGNSKAKIMLGNTSPARAAMTLMANGMRDRAVFAGYGTEVDYSATAEDMLNAICPPENAPELLVLIGHGDAEGPADSDPPVNGIEGSDDVFFSKAYVLAHNCPNSYPGVKEVWLMSCAQNAPIAVADWAKMFPNAEIRGFRTCISFFYMYWIFLRYSWHRAGDETTPGIHSFNLDVSSGLRAHPANMSVPGGWAVAPPTPLNPAFRMSPDLAAQFGTQVANVYSRPDTGGAARFLVGLSISDGRTVAYSDTIPLPGVSFEITIGDSDIVSALEDPSTFPIAYADGRVDVDPLTTAVPADVLAQGIAATLYGVGADVLGVQGPPPALALERIKPNPLQGGELMVSFRLPNDAPALLELVDIAGRRVAQHAVGGVTPGLHSVKLAEAGRLAPGVYRVRLSQLEHVLETRLVVLH